MTLYGLSGYGQSGKDTVADFMVEMGYTKIAFADLLRTSLLTLNPHLQYREGEDFFSLKQLWDWYGYEKLKASSPQFRGLLQRMGTDVGRDLLGEDTWVNATLNSMDPQKDYVISDVRFPNEARAIESAGGSVVRIQRPGASPVNDHVSEVALDDYPFIVVLQNSGSLEHLKLLVTQYF